VIHPLSELGCAGDLHASCLEFAAQSGSEASLKLLETEGEGFLRIVGGGKNQEVGEIEDVLIDKVLIEDRLTSFLCHPCRPRSLRVRISQVYGRLATKLTASNTVGESAEFGKDKGHVGQSCLPKKQGTLLEQVIKFHGRDQSLTVTPARTATAKHGSPYLRSARIGTMIAHGRSEYELIAIQP